MLVKPVGKSVFVGTPQKYSIPGAFIRNWKPTCRECFDRHEEVGWLGIDEHAVHVKQDCLYHALSISVSRRRHKDTSRDPPDVHGHRDAAAPAMRFAAEQFR